jgi:hypothetical protein
MLDACKCAVQYSTICIVCAEIHTPNNLTGLSADLKVFHCVGKLRWELCLEHSPIATSGAGHHTNAASMGDEDTDPDCRLNIMLFAIPGMFLIQVTM